MSCHVFFCVDSPGKFLEVISQFLGPRPTTSKKVRSVKSSSRSHNSNSTLITYIGVKNHQFHGKYPEFFFSMAQFVESGRSFKANLQRRGSCGGLRGGCAGWVVLVFFFSGMRMKGMDEGEFFFSFFFVAFLSHKA